jgi:tetratricopeptide (TPR) repeat protein
VFRLLATALLIAKLGTAATASKFEFRGEIVPHRVASISLHAVATPFAVATFAGPDGRFHFKDLQAGTYTLSVSTQLGSEVRKTVEIGPATADRKRKVTAAISMDTDAPHHDRAGTVSARALQIPDSAQREYQQALRSVGKRDFDGAASCLQRAVAIAPGFSAAWNQLGTMAYQSQQYQQAANYFRQGLKADPDAFEPIVNLGGVLLNLVSLNVANLQEALKYNREAVKRRPQDALAQSQLGMSYALSNQLDSAEKHLVLAIHLDPNHFSRPQLTLSDVYFRKHDLQHAADQLEDFLRLHQDWPAAPKMKELIAEWRKGNEPILNQRAADQRR